MSGYIGNSGFQGSWNNLREQLMNAQRQYYGGVSGWSYQEYPIETIHDKRMRVLGTILQYDHNERMRLLHDLIYGN